MKCGVFHGSIHCSFCFQDDYGPLQLIDGSFSTCFYCKLCSYFCRKALKKRTSYSLCNQCCKYLRLEFDNEMSFTRVLYRKILLWPWVTYFAVQPGFALDTQWNQTGSCHKRQKPQGPAPQPPIRNRQTTKVANAKGLNRNTNLT